MQKWKKCLSAPFWRHLWPGESSLFFWHHFPHAPSITAHREYPRESPLTGGVWVLQLWSQESLLLLILWFMSSSSLQSLLRWCFCNQAGHPSPAFFSSMLTNGKTRAAVWAVGRMEKGIYWSWFSQEQGVLVSETENPEERLVVTGSTGLVSGRYS